MAASPLTLGSFGTALCPNPRASCDPPPSAAQPGPVRVGLALAIALAGLAGLVCPIRMDRLHLDRSAGAGAVAADFENRELDQQIAPLFGYRLYCFT